MFLNTYLLRMLYNNLSTITSVVRFVSMLLMILNSAKRARSSIAKSVFHHAWRKTRHVQIVDKNGNLRVQSEGLLSSTWSLKNSFVTNAKQDSAMHSDISIGKRVILLGLSALSKAASRFIQSKCSKIKMNFEFILAQIVQWLKFNVLTVARNTQD